VAEPRSRRVLGPLGWRYISAKDEGVDTMLPSDIRTAFESMGSDRLSSETLTTFLTDIEGRP
jgi:hypothetical protein